jgi:hypothetical protein
MRTKCKKKIKKECKKILRIKVINDEILQKALSLSASSLLSLSSFPVLSCDYLRLTSTYPWKTMRHTTILGYETSDLLLVGSKSMDRNDVRSRGLVRVEVFSQCYDTL